jgi:hypothetical protein
VCLSFPHTRNLSCRLSLSLSLPNFPQSLSRSSTHLLAHPLTISF